MEVKNWADISTILEKTKTSSHSQELSPRIAFITFNYGIDGVSIEISKYARCFEKIFGENTEVHLIGGQFFENSNAVLKKRWKKLAIPNFDGWDKWAGGKWFEKLFYSDMPADSELSDKMAVEIYNQATEFSEILYKYLTENNISIVRCIVSAITYLDLNLG